MSNRYRFAAMTALAALVFPSEMLAQTGTTAAVDDPGSVMVVMDASGSMWGQIDGKTKIEIARETLRKSLAGVPAGREIGLIAYGHRRKGDCSDIEVLSTPAAGNGKAIAGAVDKLNPKGKTPLSDAVRLAAKELRSTEKKATVILLTDGLETCSADPCALGRELEASGVDFTTHVIGFGLSRDEGRQMACLAEETGGRYFPAENAEQLDAALGETVDVKPGEPDEPVKAEVIPEVTLSGPDTVSIGQTFEVTWSGADGKDDYIDIMPAGEDRTHSEASYSWTRDGSPLSILAPGEPGDYNLRYVMQGLSERRVLASQPLKVTPGDFTVVVPETAIVGSAIPIKWEAAAPLSGSYIDLVPAGFTETSGELSYAYISEGADLTMSAPVEPGTYDVRFVLEAPEGRLVKFTTQITVLEAEAMVEFPAVVNAGETFSLTWDGPAGASSYVDLVPQGYTETSGELSYAYVADGDVLSMTAPDAPGVYQVRFILEARERRVIFSSPLTVR